MSILTSRQNEVLEKYKKYILDITENIDLRGIPGCRDLFSVPLNNIYIELQTVAKKESDKQHQNEKDEINKAAVKYNLEKVIALGVTPNIKIPGSRVA